MIRYVTPYALDGNLAKAMNLEMEIAPKGSYVGFVDADTTWLDNKYGGKIAEMIHLHGEAYYTCTTNRTNCEWQKYDWAATWDKLSDLSLNDIERHRNRAKWLWESQWRNSHAVEDHTHSQLWSGHLMICPVDLWIPLKTKGLLGVDNEIHLNARKQGSRVLLMTGIYMYHWYSNFDGKSGHQKRDKSHLL